MSNSEFIDFLQGLKVTRFKSRSSREMHLIIILSKAFRETKYSVNVHLTTTLLTNWKVLNETTLKTAIYLKVLQHHRHHHRLNAVLYTCDHYSFHPESKSNTYCTYNHLFICIYAKNITD